MRTDTMKKFDDFYDRLGFRHPLDKRGDGRKVIVIDKCGEKAGEMTDALCFIELGNHYHPVDKDGKVQTGVLRWLKFRDGLQLKLEEEER